MARRSRSTRRRTRRGGAWFTSPLSSTPPPPPSHLEKEYTAARFAEDAAEAEVDSALMAQMRNPSDANKKMFDAADDRLKVARAAVEAAKAKKAGTYGFKEGSGKRRRGTRRA